MASTQIEQNKYGFYHITPDQFQTKIIDAVQSYRDTIKKIKQIKSHDWQSSIQPMELASENLDRNWHLLEHVNAVANTPEIRETYEKLLQIVTNFHTEVSQDQELFNIYEKVQAEATSLSKPQQTILQHAIRNFKLSGINLAPNQRERIGQLHEKLSNLESKFSNNLLDSTEGWTYHVTTAQKYLLEGIPERVVDAAKAKAEQLDKSGWIFGLDAATYSDVISYANNRELREEFYNAYNTRASDQGPMAGKFDNTKVIQEILAVRQEIAQILGFPNYAAYSLEPKMANSTDEVNNFLTDIISKVKPFAVKEAQTLKDFAKEQGFAMELEAWDLAYYAEKLRQHKFQINEEELRAYFPLPKVLDGLFKLVNKLYGLKIEEVADFDSWHESVRFYKVLDQENKLRGHFYTDLFARPGKRSGAWMAECVTRMRFGSNLLQTSTAFLNCNFPAPTQKKPATLTHQEVLTLFHEFGHTLHHVLTLVDYYSAAGMNGVEWDAIELPSQLMEHWGWEWQIIQQISANVFSGEAMPKDIYDRLLASKNFNTGLFLSKQLTFSLFDFRVHEKRAEDVEKSAHEVLVDVRDDLSVFATPSTNRFENTFQHIFSGGYAAGYYSYLWAEVLACDAYQKLTTNDLCDSKIGREFLTNILEKGGSEPAMDLFVAFMGRKPKIDALLKNYALE